MKNKKQIALIQSLLNSSREEQIVILEKNLKLIDDDFARVLRKWATKTLEEVKFRQAKNIIIKILNFSTLIGDFPLGTKSSNVEIAIAGFKLGMKIFNRYTSPKEWATTQHNLGSSCRDRIKEDRAENLEKAIACYQLALSVFTCEAFPRDWALTQNNFANAYKDRIKGDKKENIEMAIECLKAGLSVYTREAFPEGWAMIHYNLANAYNDRIKGDKKENIEMAIESFQAVLQVRTRKAFPRLWAMTQKDLANAYCNRMVGNKEENIETAIDLYQAVLEVLTHKDFPEYWAQTQNNLANAYSNRIREDKAQNIERAIACCYLALEVRTRADFPQQWAMTQNNLGEAYQEKRLIPEAIKCFKSSLEIFKPDALPLSCLKAARNLGNTAFDIEQWETAIFGYEKAIEAVEQSREWIASQNRKREIIGENLNVYEKMIQSCINHQQYHKAIQTTERSKSRYLVELFTNSEIYPKTATKTEKQQLQNLRRQIASLQQSLETEIPVSSPENTGETGNPGGQRTTQTRTQSPESSQQQQDKLATALQQLEQYLENFKQREPEFKLTQKIQPIDITQFQKTLDPQTAIIEWYIGNNSNSNSNSPLLKGGWGGSDPSITTNNSNSDNSWGGSAFIITHDNIELITYTTTEIAELETWKNNYLDQYRDKKTNQIWQTTLSQKLEKLSQILRLNEIIAKIETSHQLILIPHRYLHLFPLHALPFTSETRFTQKTNFRGNLLDCFPDGVKYSPSLQLLELVKNRITTRKSPPPNQQQLFALQNPTEDLFNADMEVETIKTRFDLHQILLRKAATKIALNASGENLANANYLHFSCHGVFDFDYPLQSSLILADSLEPLPPKSVGAVPPCPPEPKRTITLRSGRKAIPEKCLTLRDIFGELQLPQCSLVTLSACETGLTTSTAMTDEYIGLPSGFLYAGSMNVVSSLWAVDDFATAILMIKFYQELPNADSVAIALNAAQNWMRAVSLEDFRVWIGLLKLDEKSMKTAQEWLSYSSKDRPPFKDPEYWAAFCATGY